MEKGYFELKFSHGDPDTKTNKLSCTCNGKKNCLRASLPEAIRKCLLRKLQIYIAGRPWWGLLGAEVSDFQVFPVKSSGFCNILTRRRFFGWWLEFLKPVLHPIELKTILWVCPTLGYFPQNFQLERVQKSWYDFAVYVCPVNFSSLGRFRINSVKNWF